MWYSWRRRNHSTQHTILSYWERQHNSNCYIVLFVSEQQYEGSLCFDNTQMLLNVELHCFYQVNLNTVRKEEEWNFLLIYGINMTYLIRTTSSNNFIWSKISGLWRITYVCILNNYFLVLKSQVFLNLHSKR